MISIVTNIVPQQDTCMYRHCVHILLCPSAGRSLDTNVETVKNLPHDDQELTATMSTENSKAPERSSHIINSPIQSTTKRHDYAVKSLKVTFQTHLFTGIFLLD